MVRKVLRRKAVGIIRRHVGVILVLKMILTLNKY